MLRYPYLLLTIIRCQFDLVEWVVLSGPSASTRPHFIKKKLGLVRIAFFSPIQISLVERKTSKPIRFKATTMVFTTLYTYRNGYIRLLSALNVAIMGPWVGCQLAILIQQGQYIIEDVNLMASSGLYCVVYALSIALLAYPEQQVKNNERLFGNFNLLGKF